MSLPEIIEKFLPPEDEVFGVTLYDAMNKNIEISMAQDDFSKSFPRINSKVRLTGKLWEVIRSCVFWRDGNTCVYCGSKNELHCDHIIPISKGGTNNISNLNTSCRECNLSKKARDLSDWYPKLTDVLEERYESEYEEGYS